MRQLTKQIAILDTFVPDWDELPPHLKLRCETVKSVHVPIAGRDDEPFSDHGSWVFYEITRTLIDVTVHCHEIINRHGGKVSDFIKGLWNCWKLDLDLVHTSTGTSRLTSDEMVDLVEVSKALRKKGTILTASAGNAGLDMITGREDSSVLFPAALPEWIAFGSSQDGIRSDWSSVGPEVMFTIDGEDEYSWGLSGRTKWSGTSLAAPRAASLILGILYDLADYPDPPEDMQKAILMILPFLAFHPDREHKPTFRLTYRDDKFGYGSLNPVLKKMREIFKRWKEWNEQNKN